MNTSAQKPNGPDASVAFNPRAYQHTHKLAESAHDKVRLFGEDLYRVAERVVDLEKDNAQLWDRLHKASVRRDEMLLMADRLKHAQVATTISVIVCAVCFGMVVLAFMLAGRGV